MENASKALLMAASVLIGVLILSLMVYLFSSFGASSKQMRAQLEQDQINRFNAQFTKYEDKKAGISIYDVITIANLATENNRYYELKKIPNISSIKEQDLYISVILKQGYATSSTYNQLEYGYEDEANAVTNNNIIEGELNDIFKKKSDNEMNVEDINRYKCKVYISSITRRVYKVEIDIK